MLMRGKKNKVENQMNEQRSLRELDTAEIRRISEKMTQLVENSVDADELTKAVNAADYRMLEQELAAAKERFNERTRRISQMQTAKMTEARLADAEKAAKERGRFDLNKLQEKADYLAAQNETFQEEDERFSIATMTSVSERATIPMDLEFDTLVTRAAVKKSLESIPETVEDVKMNA